MGDVQPLATDTALTCRASSADMLGAGALGAADAVVGGVLGAVDAVDAGALDVAAMASALASHKLIDTLRMAVTLASPVIL